MLLPLHFFRTLDNSYSHNVFMSECSSTGYCSWLLTIYLFLWNLKTVRKSPYKYKSLVLSQISFRWKLSFTVRNACAFTLITCPRLKQMKSENNSLSDYLFFYRLWHVRSFIYASLGISSYCFRLDASKNRLSTTYYPFYTKLKWYQLYTINKVNQLLK